VVDDPTPASPVHAGNEAVHQHERGGKPDSQ
jgi:hypothetical protein